MAPEINNLAESLKKNHMGFTIYEKGTKFDDFQKSVHISPLYSGN